VVKEESVGFLFNLEVEVDEDGAATATAPTIVASAPQAPSLEKAPAVESAADDEPVDDDGMPQLDLSLLEAAQEQHEASTNGKPKINAKGLDRSGGEKPLTYSAPDLGSDAPAVQTSGGGDKSATGSTTAKRQQARSNPNRGSRGNKGGSAKNKRKR
jgi:preprotein translocase subunit SecA